MKTRRKREPVCRATGGFVLAGAFSARDVLLWKPSDSQDQRDNQEHETLPWMEVVGGAHSTAEWLSTGQSSKRRLLTGEEKGTIESKSTQRSDTKRYTIHTFSQQKGAWETNDAYVPESAWEHALLEHGTQTYLKVYMYVNKRLAGHAMIDVPANVKKEQWPKACAVKHIGTGSEGGVYSYYYDYANGTTGCTSLVVKVANVTRDVINGEMLSTSYIMQQLERTDQSAEDTRVVPVFEYGVALMKGRRCAFYIMKRMEGSVSDLRRRSTAPLTLTRAWFNDLVKAAYACLEMGFVHLDIKPDNVLYDSENRLFLADFGYSQLVMDHTANVAPHVASIRQLPPEVLECHFPSTSDDKTPLSTSGEAHMVYQIASVLAFIADPRYAAYIDEWGKFVVEFFKSTYKGSMPSFQAAHREFLRKRGGSYQANVLAEDTGLTTVIRQMLDEDPSKRPTLRNLLTLKALSDKTAFDHERAFRANKRYVTQRIPDSRKDKPELLRMLYQHALLWRQNEFLGRSPASILALCSCAAHILAVFPNIRHIKTVLQYAVLLWGHNYKTATSAAYHSDSAGQSVHVWCANGASQPFAMIESLRTASSARICNNQVVAMNQMAEYSQVADQINLTTLLGFTYLFDCLVNTGDKPTSSPSKPVLMNVRNKYMAVLWPYVGLEKRIERTFSTLSTLMHDVKIEVKKAVESVKVSVAETIGDTADDALLRLFKRAFYICAVFASGKQSNQPNGYAERVVRFLVAANGYTSNVREESGGDADLYPLMAACAVSLSATDVKEFD
jgi:serine/threonine protein kinase